MAYTTVNKSTAHHNTILWTGNTASTRSHTGVGFQPDLVWVKNRSTSSDHRLSCRVLAANGTGQHLVTNDSAAADGSSTAITSLDADGFSTGNEQSYNNNGSNHVAWCWKAAGAGSSNTDGSINTNSTSVNTTAGFSASVYTGNGTGNSSVGHGLGVAPRFIIIKNLSAVGLWGVKSDSYVSAANPNVLYMNNTAAESDDTNVFGTSAAFTSTTFTIGTWAGSNTNTNDYLALCWAEKSGFSKFGKYTGNGQSDGPFVFTGFKPAFLMVKSHIGTDNWIMLDNKRSGYNSENEHINANGNAAESDGSGNIDLLSNGFKIRSSFASLNWNGGSYIYMAFGQTMVGTNNTPANAR